ncbi:MULTISPECIES: hypothetical protein [Acinetobacter]|uniref:hypothetical protein n=1 Tax=Acinetobacter TaxID=469 RepID=UPI0020054461|nr:MULTISPECIES: hypothetical protein [Acinetobacter]MCK4081337.1 hypothetical protein [Acinetobacter radioresistens]
MKLIDRFLVFRRAILVALNPNCKAVLIKRQGKDGKIYKNCIFSDRETATDFYKQDMLDLFTEKARNGKNLKHLVNVWVQWVQEDWNKKNPNDSVNFFAEDAEHD